MHKRWLLGLALVSGAAAADERGDATVARNVFCSSCERAREKVAVAATAAVDVDLEGTMVVARDEAWSMALVRERASGRPRLLRRGATLADGALVIRVVDRRVYLARAGRLEQIDLATASPPPSPSPPSTRWQGIRCGGGRCQIERALLERIAQNPAAVAGDALFLPASRDGRPWGFRINAIRPGSLFAELGLQNGDVVTAVNGRPTATPDQLLSLMTWLRHAGAVTVAIDRRGAAVALDYTIH